VIKLSERHSQMPAGKRAGASSLKTDPVKDNEVREWPIPLVCPRDASSLRSDSDGNTLRCQREHQYRVIDGIPILLIEEAVQTHSAALATLKAKAEDGPWYFETLGCSPAERIAIASETASHDKRLVDPVASWLIAATNGRLYTHLVGRLSSYPIPNVRLPESEGRTLVDVGCNWGRWSLAAARKGYRVIGIDPSLGAIAAARRVAKELGIAATFIVGDARYLPLPNASLDTCFSYSVFQHFEKSDARTALKEISRVLKTKGLSLIQMPNTIGIGNLRHEVKRGFRKAREFEVRYWTPGELISTFTELIGESRLTVDGFFGLGIQTSDVEHLSRRSRLIVRTSEQLRAFSQYLHLLNYLADSLYVSSVRRDYA
jgi:SAM-dependent methyltransferase/uncharacterized protein YbaR (Trm112 family)